MTAAAARPKRPSIKSRFYSRGFVILLLAGLGAFGMTKYGGNCVRAAGCECCAFGFSWSEATCKELPSAAAKGCDPALKQAAVNAARTVRFDVPMFATLWAVFAVTLSVVYVIVFAIRFILTGGRLS